MIPIPWIWPGWRPDQLDWGLYRRGFEGPQGGRRGRNGGNVTTSRWRVSVAGPPPWLIPGEQGPSEPRRQGRSKGRSEGRRRGQGSAGPPRPMSAAHRLPPPGASRACPQSDAGDPPWNSGTAPVGQGRTVRSDRSGTALADSGLAAYMRFNSGGSASTPEPPPAGYCGPLGPLFCFWT